MVPAREVEGKVPLYNETVMTVAYQLMVGADAPRHALPHHSAAIASNLEAIPKLPCFIFTPHESEEGHVNRLGSQPERFKVQAEVLVETVEKPNLQLASM